MSAPLTVFYSYAHKDETLRDRLADHLRSLQAQGLISEWHDRQIVAGTEWAYVIDSHLQTASIILLLISPAFMASDYCVSNEMQQAMERHRLGDARVIPIILEPAAWQDAPFATLQCLPRGAKPMTTWDNPEDAFEDVVQGLRHAIEDLNGIYAGHDPHHPSELLTLPPTADHGRKESSRPSALIDSRSRQRMLERVRARWITGLLKDSLNQAALLTLGLQEQPDAVANPWSFALQEMHQPARPLRLGTRIIQAYVYAQGDLLILGEPGAGKTTLLLELTRDLIERAKRDETHPLPVVFNLSSWSLKPQPLAEWLVEELILKYQVPRKLAKRWVEAEQILPLLDGLDEVAPNKRAGCVEAVNRYKQAHGLLPMVICSRTADYLAQQARVLLRTAIIIQPLTPEQIEVYLGSAKQQLAPVREALQADAELQELASTPLMLSILALAYHGSSPSELLAISSPLARRQRIFATYVQRMFQRRGSNVRHTPQQMQRWLHWLAQQMRQRSQSEFYLEWMQPNWLPAGEGGWYRKLVMLGSGLFFGLMFGLGIGPLFELGNWLGTGAVYGLGDWLVLGLSGVFFGLVAGLVAGLVVSKRDRIQLTEVLGWSWRGVWSKFTGGLRWGLLFGLSFGSCSGLLGGLLIGLVYGLRSGLVVGLVTGLEVLGLMLLTCGVLIGPGVGLIVGLVRGVVSGWTKATLDQHHRLRPNEGTRRSAQNASYALLIIWLLVGLIFELLFGLFLALYSGLSYGLALGLSYGLSLGLFFGLLGGLLNGGIACIQHGVLRLLLWRVRSTPWRYARFLEDAAERILLRKVGGGYIFVHRLLLEYFASLETAAEAGTAPVHQSPSPAAPEYPCSHCGVLLPTSARFCGRCGQAVIQRT